MYKVLGPGAVPSAILRQLSRRPTGAFQQINSVLIRQLRRGYAAESGTLKPLLGQSPRLLISFTEDRDLVIIGGGVAGYVAAIKAGQEGLKVKTSFQSYA